MIFLTKADFRDQYELTFPKINGREAIVEGSLAILEKQELVELLGVDLAQTFEAAPLDPIFDAIKNPILEGNRYSSGLKNVLLSFVYLKYQKGNFVLATENGRVQKDSSVSKPVSTYTRDIEMYNTAVIGWRAIQLYSRREYPTFKGIDKLIQMY